MNLFLLVLNNKKYSYFFMLRAGLVPVVSRRQSMSRRETNRLAMLAQADARFLAPKTSDWTKNGLFSHGR